MSEKDYFVEDPYYKSDSGSRRNRERNDTAKNTENEAGDQLSNGYIGGDRTRSSSSHQFHRDNSREGSK